MAVSSRLLIPDSGWRERSADKVVLGWFLM